MSANFKKKIPIDLKLYTSAFTCLNLFKLGVKVLEVLPHEDVVTWKKIGVLNCIFWRSMEGEREFTNRCPAQWARINCSTKYQH